MLDSGCTQHMTGDPMMFSSLDENEVGYSDIIFGDNSRGKVKGVGTIPISSDHSLSKVLLVDSLKFNLLAVTQLCDFGYNCSFTKDDVVVTSLMEMIIYSRDLDMRMYILWILLLKRQTCLLACSLNHLWVGYGIEDLVMLA